jgi:hypothetical protein
VTADVAGALLNQLPAHTLSLECDETEVLEKK